MKKHLFLSLALTGITAASAAMADGPSSVDPDPTLIPIDPAPQTANWAGFYGGLSAVSGEGTVDWVDVPGVFFSFIAGATYSQDNAANGGGAHIGYNWQTPDNMVYGVELSAAFLDMENTGVSPYFPTSDTLGTSVSDPVMLTGRLGFATGNWLPYIEAGIASAEVGVNNVDVVNCLPLTCVFDMSERQTGYVLGIGFDYRLSETSSIGLNFRHIDLGDLDMTGPTTNTIFVETFNVSAVADIISLRWSFHF